MVTKSFGHELAGNSEGRLEVPELLSSVVFIPENKERNGADERFSRKDDSTLHLCLLINTPIPIRSESMDLGLLSLNLWA